MRKVIWGAAVSLDLDTGLPTTRRRIQALAPGRDGDWTFLEVGMETPDGDPVLAIFEVCTPRQVVEDGPPDALGLAEGAPVVDFDEG